MSRIHRWVCAPVLGVLVLAGCGSNEQAAPPAANQPDQSTEIAEPRQSKVDRMLAERMSGKSTIERMAESDDPKVRQMAEVMRATEEMERLRKDPNATEADKQAALEAYMIANRNTGRRDKNVKQPVLDLPADWAAHYRVERNAAEAELLVQVGDIDNLGFGWPTEFDPFSGKSTPVHRYPWAPGEKDPPGTDRIMVNSGATELSTRKDGYTRDTYRPDNLPQPLAIEFDPKAVPIKAALLQLFVDDFQAPVATTRFSVTLDGRPAPDIETLINKLNQTGPIGKLVTIRLLPEYLALLSDGKLEILIDDPTTQAGDGFAFDFARLLINPKGFEYSGTVRGIVVDKQSKAPIGGALASAGNVRQATTGADGRFELKEVPAGLVVVTGSHTDYITGSEQSDLLADDVLDLTILLDRTKNEDLAERLQSEGKVDLYGIYFDTDKDVIKGESEAALQQVLSMLKGKPDLRIAIAGHTDAQASDDYNLDLSQRRARAVMAWLTGKDIVAARLSAQGYGESRPVADNESAAGRALNRRVEIRDMSR